MAEKSDTKLDPAEQSSATGEPKLARDETENVTGLSSTGDSSATDKAQDTAAKTDASKDSLFSMFRGGPPKKRAEEDDEGEEKGGGKKKNDDVRGRPFFDPSRKH